MVERENRRKLIDFKSNEIDHSDAYIARWRPIIESWAARSSQLSVNFHFDDRVQYGLIGVWRAINSYDPVKHPNVPLSAWISRKVKRYMLDGSIHESGRGGGGYTYGHVIHMEDMVRELQSTEYWTEEAEEIEEVFKFLQVDTIEEVFSFLDAMDRVRKLRLVIVSIKDGDLLLRNLDGMTMKAIGVEIGRSESYISKKLTIVRYLLREKLDE